MRRRQRRGLGARRRARELGTNPRKEVEQIPPRSPQTCLARRALLLGTVFASTLLPALLAAPQSAQALPCIKTPPPGPIFTLPLLPFSVTCVNSDDRIDPGVTIFLSTSLNGSFINLNNSGNLATLGLAAISIDAATIGPNSDITIFNSGDIATLGLGSIGINALTLGSGSDIEIRTIGDIATLGLGAIGINAITSGPGADISIINDGDIATLGMGAIGIRAATSNRDSSVAVTNSGDIATLGMGAIGIDAGTSGLRSDISIVNEGDIATSGIDAVGIRGTTSNTDSGIVITNSGDIATSARDAIGIGALTLGAGSSIVIDNAGDIQTIDRYAYGISVETNGTGSSIVIDNAGDIQTRARYAYGISAETNGVGSAVAIDNTGDITTQGIGAHGIYANTFASSSGILIQNSADITTRGLGGAGIEAYSSGDNSPVTIINSGKIDVQHPYSAAISAASIGLGSPLQITNSGSIEGGFAGILALSETTTIVNSGSITADSLFAIGIAGAEANIFNTGTITGFVDLFALGNFVNQRGGVFEARQLSNFGFGDSEFLNQDGAIVHTAADPTVAETTTFVGLERFENQGVISLVDGKEGDVFELTNCGCSVLDFAGSGDSTLAVDAFLGGPGSTADNFIIDGNTSGETALSVHNTSPGGGSYNTKGIPVVFANGNVKPDAFYLKKPVDAGLFDYDLIFRPTGSGVFELKSFPGGGSHSSPHIITTSQDLLHTSSETWLDRSADLRVLLNTTSHNPATQAAGAQSNDVTPAVWVRGAGTWLNQDDKATTNAYGRTYKHSLDRHLETSNFQTGVDLGKRDVLSQGDMVVFGPLAGVVLGSLDYDDLAREFDFTAAEIGGYATYLKGGLFVDTQAKVHFMEVDPKDVRGLPDTFGAANYGLRTDTGYRFGSFNGGMFVEPLATLAVTWTNIDNLAIDGNTVSFDDEVNVRGRLGLRVGTDYEVWSGTTMEPFVIGSVWGNLSGDNDATVVSNNTTFEFTDKPEDVWSVLSAGVNFFNPGAQTTVFAKLDVTVADETDGISAKAGMRYNW